METTTNMDLSELCEGDILHGQTATYTVLRFLGEGSFGMVVECLKTDTNERVAVKMLKDPAAIRQAEEEVQMLEKIGQLDSERCNVVQFKECFQYMGLTCLVFEMLHISLWDLLKNHRPVLSISELRPIAQQLLVAFNALKDIDVIHADLKPDNVMLTNQPYRVKLIDFGMALTTSEVEQGVIMQPSAYRAPEVTLGCVYDFPIDMWGLGCTLVRLLAGTNLFPCCGYQSIKMMVDLLGMPPDDMLNNGKHTKFYFTKEEDGRPSPTWRLLTPNEYSRVSHQEPGEPGPLQNDLTTLDSLLNSFVCQDEEQAEDLRMCMDLLKSLLSVDPRLRVTPVQALQHPFITMTHLSQDSDYGTICRSVMQHVTPVESDAHQGGQLPVFPDDAQSKVSSLVSLDSAAAAPEVVSARGVEPFPQADGSHPAESLTSSEEHASHGAGHEVRPDSTQQPPSIQMPSQAEEVYPVHYNQHVDQGVEIRSSEGELPQTELQNRTHDKAESTDQDSGQVSGPVETSDSPDLSPVIPLVSQPNEDYVASTCDPLDIQQNVDEETTHLDLSELCEGDILHGQTATYTVLRFLGEGSFGMVVECLKMDTNERVAVKMLKDPAAISEAEEEVQMLEIIGQLDSERCNVVQFKECFQYMGLTCLVFEMLNISLWDLLKKHGPVPTISELRPIAQQLLVAFNALKDIDVIHADLKPDNVMLTNQPYRVKLIDFGLALTTSEVEQGVIMQPAAFRAPEVTLGCVYDFPIDMWGLGCTLAHLLAGTNLFPCCEYQSIKMMVDLLGMPPDDMLNNGRYTKFYFTKEEDGRPNPTWRLLTPNEYSRVNRQEPGEPGPLQNDLTTLDDLLNSFVCQDEEQAEDLRMCVDLLKSLLSVDPRLRVTPVQALQHPFITMTHLSQDSHYGTFCRSVMQHVNPTESDAHQGGQLPVFPDDAQSKVSSLVSLDSAAAAPEVVSARAVEPFPQADGSHPAESLTSSEEHASHGAGHEVRPDSTQQPPSIQMPSQAEEVYPVHYNQHVDQGVEIRSSEGELPQTELQNRTHNKAESTDQDSGQVSGPVETSDSPDLSPVIPLVSQPNEDNVASTCDPLDIQQNVDEETTHLDLSELCEGDILHGQTATYTVLRFLGEGSFGMVVECLKMDTNERVAVKMLKDPAAISEAEEEVQMLEIIGQLDSERCNVVQFKECFQYMGLTCLVFEMLNISLWDLLKKHGPVPTISELRPIAQQLLVAFNALKDIDVIHADLKPDNVMLTNQPYRVKLIDFGLALTTSEVEQGVIMQPAAFRAPEVTLGCVYDFPIDMWGLGCTLAHLLAGTNLFPCCEYQSIKMMVDLLGMPPDDMLNNGRYTKFYFTKEEDGRPNPTWRLLTPNEYSRVNRQEPGEPGPLQNDLTTLDDLLNSFVCQDEEQAEDLRMCVDLLKSLLSVDPRLRVTPVQALQHPFITMTHLSQDSHYGTFCRSVMQHVNPTESDAHQGGQLPVFPDDAQSKVSSLVSLDSAAAAPEVVSARAVEPFPQADGSHPAESLTSSEEHASHGAGHEVRPDSTQQPPSIQMPSQAEEVYPVHYNQHVDQGVEIRSSEGELPQTELQNRTHDKAESTDQDSGQVSGPVETSDSPDLSPVIPLVSQPNEDNVASTCDPLDIQQNVDEETTHLDLSELCEGDILHGQTATYTVLRFLGEGSFGMVVECLKMDTNERVAVKMLKDPAAISEAEEEVQMLEIIGQLDSERCNVVQFKECFQYMGLTCLVFEMLNISLWDLLKKHGPVPTISELRPIAQQLLVAFNALKDIDVIHADLKPDNVMLTNQPYRVKLIDFGLALTTSEVEQGVIMQPAAFRAPEVTLGCVYDFPIDMWGLGCTLAHLLAGTNLFPCCEYQSIKMMVDLLGMPPDDMLNNGRYTKFYFTKEEDGRPNPTWRLLTPNEYSRVNRQEPGEPGPLQNDLTTLDDLLNSFVCQDEEQAEDLRMCVDLLKSLLSVDPRLRVTPVQALQHPFITMTHLSQDSHYGTFCRSVMQHVNPTESDAHQGGQLPVFPDDAQSKVSSLVSLDSAAAAPEVVSARAVEPFPQADGSHPAESLTSSEEHASHGAGHEVRPDSTQQPPSIQMPSQAEEVYPVHYNQHVDQGVEIRSSEGELPQTELQNRTHDKAESTDQDSGQVSGPVETSDSPDLSPVIPLVSQPNEDNVASTCDPLDIQQNVDEETTHLDLSELCEGDILHGQTATYTVLRFLGEGSFGMVVECLKMDTNERVAVKMLKDPAAISEAEEEVQMLEIIGQLDSERCNVVQFKECFQYMGLTCLVFEMLNISLWDLLKKHGPVPTISELRPIAQQLLVAFNALKDIDVIHADLKPDNVMLTNQPCMRTRYRVKLIDFSLALNTSEVEQGVIMQPAAFRAPEVTLGCVYDFPIDMWGLGCTLAHLLAGTNLFPCCEYQSIKMMVDLLGMPPDDMLSNGRYTKFYFTKEEDGRPNPTWRLLTPNEYSRVNRQEPGEPGPLQNDLTTLDDLLNSFVCQDEEQAEDLRMCMDLLKSLLSVDPRLRVTPVQALQHPFITMTHLSQDSLYSMETRSLMQRVILTQSDSDEGEQASTSSSPISTQPAEESDRTSARVAEPFAQEISTSSEEQPLSQRSTNFDQASHQRRDLLDIQHLNEDFGSSKGRLPHAADVDSSGVLKNEVPGTSQAQSSISWRGDADLGVSLNARLLNVELGETAANQFVLPLFVKDLNVVSLPVKAIDVGSGLGVNIHQSPTLDDNRPSSVVSSLNQIPFSPAAHSKTKKDLQEAILINNRNMSDPGHSLQEKCNRRGESKTSALHSLTLQAARSESGDSHVMDVSSGEGDWASITEQIESPDIKEGCGSRGLGRNVEIIKMGRAETSSKIPKPNSSSEKCGPSIIAITAALLHSPDSVIALDYKTSQLAKQDTVPMSNPQRKDEKWDRVDVDPISRAVVVHRGVQGVLDLVVVFVKCYTVSIRRLLSWLQSGIIARVFVIHVWDPGGERHVQGCVHTWSIRKRTLMYFPGTSSFVQVGSQEMRQGLAFKWTKRECAHTEQSRT